MKLMQLILKKYIVILLLLGMSGCHSWPILNIDTQGHVAAAHRKVAACKVKHPHKSLKELQINQALLWIQQDFDHYLFSLSYPPQIHPLNSTLPQWENMRALQASTNKQALIPQLTSPVFLRCLPAMSLHTDKRISTAIPQSTSPLQIRVDQWAWQREYRSKAVGIEDVALDMKTKKLYLVGSSGLWSWSLGKKSILPLSLPFPLAKPLSRIYRDGDAWWIRLGSSQKTNQPAHLVSLHSNQVQYLHYSQPMSLRIEHMQIPLADGLLIARRGDLSFIWKQNMDETVIMPIIKRYQTPAINDFALLDQYHIAIAHDLGVDIWQKFPNQDDLTHVFTLKLRHPTVRLIVFQNMLYMIGRSYGILWAQFKFN